MDIPEGVIDRLPKYARALGQLEAEGRDVVSSQELGVRLNITHAQIRKDLSYFGRFGKQGRGYNVQKLLDELRRIVGLNRQWKMAHVRHIDPVLALQAMTYHLKADSGPG